MVQRAGGGDGHDGVTRIARARDQHRALTDRMQAALARFTAPAVAVRRITARWDQLAPIAPRPRALVAPAGQLAIAWAPVRRLDGVRDRLCPPGPPRVVAIQEPFLTAMKTRTSDEA